MIIIRVIDSDYVDCDHDNILITIYDEGNDNDVNYENGNE